MGATKASILVICAASCAALQTTALAAPDLGRQVLAPNDGWASSGSGTTGGSLATTDQVYVVTNRRQLIAALNNGVESSTSPSTPSNSAKIIYVKGSIDANVDDDNNPLTCEDYYRPDPVTNEPFSWEAFEAAFAGGVTPAGPQERARAASAAAQQLRVRIRPGSNTTIVGVGRNATIKGAWLDVRGTAGVVGSRTNIIVRNINFRDTFDCFPVWAPNDGANGAWNALYDSISLRDSDHVWVDRNLFEDRETADSTLPLRFGVIFQVHDGLLDITNASDFVTVSYNRFSNHDKTMLIGSSDTAPDAGKLRVTLHHNWFEALGQRGPRVRFGQVHIYNNFYEIKDAVTYGYSWGVGVQSQIYAESNAFCTVEGVPPARFITRFNGTAAFAADTYVYLGDGSGHVDVVGEYNAVNTPMLTPTVSWAPTLFTKIDRSDLLYDIVPRKAGPR